MKKSFIKTAQDVINLEISGLMKLKKVLNNSFNEAVREIAKCHTDGYWRGYSESVETLSLPNWAYLTN